MKKPKTPQPQTPNTLQTRDFFQTPNYAVDLLIPFIPKGRFNWAWEPASGDGRIARRLLECTDLDVFVSDIRPSEIMPNDIYNFLEGDESGTLPFILWEWFQSGFGCIITNPPFSLKRQFYDECRKYKIPFALLVPADYSGWIIKACSEDGAEKIVPSRRIDYITPDTLNRIHEGEIYRMLELHKTMTLADFKEEYPDYWQHILVEYAEHYNYSNIDEVPRDLLYYYSTSQFHSMWLTWGFELGRTETFVELSIKDKKENI